MAIPYMEVHKMCSTSLYGMYPLGDGSGMESPCCVVLLPKIHGVALPYMYLMAQHRDDSAAMCTKAFLEQNPGEMYSTS